MSSAIEPTIEPAIVLAAYAEPVASGRRVLFVGPACSALPACLLERGARLVHVCDPDPARVAEATAKQRSGSLSFSVLGEGSLAQRDGAFDVAIVEDAGITDPIALTKRLRRALTPRGVAILASVNPETRVPLMPHRPSGAIALDYYALYDAVKAEFEHVRMLGQAPFVGYVIADFAPEATPEPSLDTAFLPTGAEEPEVFVAVASQQPVELEAFAVVQLPYRSVVSGAGDSEALRRARGSEAGVRAKLSEAEAALASERQSTALREAKLQGAEAKLQSAEAKLQSAEAKLRETETGVFARDAELSALRRELEQKQSALEAQEAKLGALSQQLAQAPSPDALSAAAADLGALEKALFERGEHIRKLERELREAERTGKELLRQLPKEAATSPVLLARETELAQKLAKTQADLVATRWALEAAVKRSGETPEA